MKTFTTCIFILVCALAPAGVSHPVFGAAPEPLITDQAGRHIDTKKPFKRIISLYGAHTENLFKLGLDHEIIGVGKNDVYPSDALKKPVFSYHDDPEKFLAARPDLVLIRPMIDRGYPDLVKRLEQNGIKVVSLQPDTVEGMFDYWEKLGKLTGRENVAGRMVEQFEAQVAKIRAKTQAISHKKRVYFEAIHSRMKTFSPNAMAIFALETAGGVNVAHDAEPVRGTNIASYGKEKILSRADEIDAYIAQKGTMNNTSVELIQKEPGFQIIKAVKNGDMLIIDEMIVSRPTMRLLEGIKKIEHFLYPQVL